MTDLPFVSCICPTYSRYPDYKHLVEEAVESFLRQDYPADRRELVLLNDCPVQKLVCDIPNVLVFNFDKRASTLGTKFNAGISLCYGEILFPWDDDDISLPWRLSRSVEMLGRGAYYKTTGHWYAERGKVWVADYKGSIRHNCSAFRKSAWKQVGGYPHVSGNQDAALDTLLRSHYTPIIDRVTQHEIFYVYRWGVSDRHLSGTSVGPCGTHQPYYDYCGTLPAVKGEFHIRPQWYDDYELIARGYACA